MEIDDHDQIAAKAPDAELADELFLALGGLHAPKAQRLSIANLSRQQYIEPDDRAEALTKRAQLTLQIANSGAVFQVFGRLIHTRLSSKCL